LLDHAAKRFGCVRGGDAARDLSPFGGEDVFESVYEEFFERSKVRSIVQFGSVKQMGKFGTLDGGVLGQREAVSVLCRGVILVTAEPAAKGDRRRSG
jgi:hypothetical protein